MNEDGTFRTCLIVGCLALVPIAAYYRIKSLATGETLDRRQEGLFILATLRPAGAVGWMGLLAFMINPAYMAWSSVPLPVSVRWVGVAVCSMAAALLIWTLHSLGANLTDTVVTRKEHTLVTRGPYHWIRHPFYSSTALVTLGVTLTAANWFFLLIGCVFVFLITLRTSTEEENLIRRFGDAYRVYMTQTGRFFSRWRP